MKKEGKEYPISANPVRVRSGHRPRLSAAMMPLRIPKNIHSTNAPSASQKVTGMRCFNRSETQAPCRNE